ncbi:MAG: flavin reductase domain protein FMN-binding protein [Dehalococcoidia bacterium]|nr:flavin reductase domain protein FMN-binding protein [Dehalococcoidia bacterium]
MRIEAAGLETEALHTLIGNLISPSPIAFISTVGRDGVYNAAPFSYVAPVCNKPPVLCISFGLREGRKKDTTRNIEYTRDFVLNVVDEGLIDRAIQAGAAYPYGVSEIQALGLTAVAGEMVKSPRIAESPINVECEVCADGGISPSRLRTVGRMGRSLYCRTRDAFERKIPPPPKA